MKKEQHKSLVGMELKSKMTQALKKHPKGLTRNSLAEAAGTTVGTKKFKSAMADLISEGAIETCEVRHGRWEKTRAVGYKLAGKSDE